MTVSKYTVHYIHVVFLPECIINYRANYLSVDSESILHMHRSIFLKSYVCLFVYLQHFTHNLVSVPFHQYKITSFSSVEGDDWIEPDKSDVVPSAMYCKIGF
jgi:hypothetical protein